MRALVIAGPREAEIRDVPEPEPQAGEVVVAVERAGICGTDIEFFTGEMAYLHTGEAEYPMRIGHEWMGTVDEVGAGVDSSWLGQRVTGDTMLGCGHCRRCLNGRQHLCAERFEIGIRRGKPGALAERLAVPVSSVLKLPETVDSTAGALVEPGGNAFRAVEAAALTLGDRCLIIGSGTIGLLCAMFARAQGVEVHLLGRRQQSLQFAAELGFDLAWTAETLPDLRWDAVIDASNAASSPGRAVDLVEPGGRVVFVGLAGEPATFDSRTLAFKDAVAVGVLSASPGLQATVNSYARGTVDPRPLVAAVVDFDQLPAILSGVRPTGAGVGPKFHINLRDWRG